MGEEVTQLVISDAGGSVVEQPKEEEPHSSVDETDKAIPALNGDELIEKCEDIKTNCDDGEPQAEELSVEKCAKRIIAINNTAVVSHKPREISIEKTRKWYSFIHRGARSNNSCENKNSADKMDKRHSWHLNDAAVIEV
jgi:hypothetical protein